jgi:hypothetical protein
VLDEDEVVERRGRQPDDGELEGEYLFLESHLGNPYERG